jgi:hypothetical protein
MVRRATAALLVVVLGLGITGLAQARIDHSRDAGFDDELLYLPNKKLLNHFTAGLDGVIADLLWLRCIQYTSKEFREERKLRWLEHMCDVITDLDPYYVAVYRHGGIFLAALKADDDASLRLLKKGMRANPTAWELPYEAAMVYLLNRRDQKGAQEAGAMYLRISDATGTAPGHVHQFALNLQRMHGLFDVERGLWQDRLEHSEDANVREMAARQLKLLDYRETVSQLDEACQAWAETHGEAPPSLDVLYEGELPAHPDVPGRYFIDTDGTVKHTAVIDAEMTRRLAMLEGGIASFEEKEGRLPADLQELRESGMLPYMPRHGYADGEWRYDPETGAVSP